MKIGIRPHAGTLLISGVASVLISACHPWFDMGKGAPPDQKPEIIVPDATPQGYRRGTPPWIPLIDACMNEGRSRAECIESLPVGVYAELVEWERATGELRRTQLRQRQTPDGFGFTVDDYVALTRPREPGEVWTLGDVVSHEHALPGFSMAFLLGLQSGVATEFAFIRPDLRAHAACLHGLERDELYRRFMTDAVTDPGEEIGEWFIRIGATHCVELDE